MIAQTLKIQDKIKWSEERGGGGGGSLKIHHHTHQDADRDMFTRTVKIGS